jgi:DNA-binding MarR family transcriptional regulator/N-acetylglutamate synthase-like GNAT family acetyltransferase
VTERVGALDEHFLGRGHPLGEARLLWEIGPGGAEVRQLRRRLGMDSGYASRLLRSLEAKGLVEVETPAGDRRVRRARLTQSGLAERAELDRLADELAASLLEPLDERRRAALVAAMAEVERLLLASSITIDVEDPASDDARWCIQQYVAELAKRFEWDPARSIPAEVEDLRLPAGLLLIARRREQPLGCCALKFHVGEPAEVKRMWVAPEARGAGLGRRLLVLVEQHAAEAGASVLRLETNGTLTEAIALYREAGYREVDPFNDEPYAHHWFEKRLA